MKRALVLKGVQIRGYCVSINTPLTFIMVVSLNESNYEIESPQEVPRKGGGRRFLLFKLCLSAFDNLFFFEDFALYLFLRYRQS